jgi:hypothetical protein
MWELLIIQKKGFIKSLKEFKFNYSSFLNLLQLASKMSALNLLGEILSKT